MRAYLQAVAQHIDNQKGAEIAEWVLWMGGLALLAGALYASLSTALISKAVSIITGITAVSSS